MTTRTYRQWADPAAETALRLLAADDARHDWQDRALCQQTDPEAFFPDKGGSTKEPKRICALCPVTASCLDYALDHNIGFGVWGGLSERERRRLRSTERRQAA